MMKIFLLITICLFISFEIEAQKTIAIVTYHVQGIAPWDPDSIKKGISGSEEAVIYVSDNLARLGYKVLVLGNPPQDSIYSLPDANPRFVKMDFNDGNFWDIAISWRMPTIAEDLRKRAAKVYLWPHDTYHWPLTENQINGFDDVLWISQWQKDQWKSINPGFEKFNNIIGNGVNPDQFHPVVQRSNPYSCIYGSNYTRGLEILLDIWPKVKEEFPKATLDIYYGWQHCLIQAPPPEQEVRMRRKLDALSSLDVSEHGQVGHEALNRAYEKSSFWTYPCIVPEVFCITALRAQLAGSVPVIIDGSALPETVRHGFKCQKAEDYLTLLLEAMSNAEGISVNERKNMGDFVLQNFTWDAVAGKWKDLFE